MKNRIIRAVSGNHALLRNGQIPIIGFTCDKVSYIGDGCVVSLEVCFILRCGGKKYRDYFYFQNNRLTFQVITIKNEKHQYITATYQECIREEMTPERFIGRVVDEYVNTEMGFE